MPKHPYEWRVDSHGCYKFDNAQLGFGPRDQSAHLPVFLPSALYKNHRPQLRRLERAAGKQERQKHRKKYSRHAEPGLISTFPLGNTLVVQPAPPGFHRLCFGDSSPNSHHFKRIQVICLAVSSDS